MEVVTVNENIACLYDTGVDIGALLSRSLVQPDRLTLTDATIDIKDQYGVQLQRDYQWRKSGYCLITSRRSRLP